MEKNTIAVEEDFIIENLNEEYKVPI